MSGLQEQALERLNHLNETQSHLAHMVGVSEKHLSQVLTGHVSGSRALWESIAKVLGMRLMLAAEPAPPSPEAPVSGTLRRVARPRGELDTDRRKRLERLAEKAEAAKANLRADALQALADGGSFAWVAEVTGLSTNTLQRWKREES